MSLPDQQAGRHVIGEADRGGVGVRDLRSTQRCERALVVREREARLEEQRQVHAGAHEHEERVQGDLTELKGPVVWKDVLHDRAKGGGGSQPALEEASGVAFGMSHWLRTPHHAGPTGPESGPPARSVRSAAITSGSCGSGRPAGPLVTAAARRTAKTE